MSNEYVKNNEGTGFALGSDDDLTSMLNDAKAGIEPEENGDAMFFDEAPSQPQQTQSVQQQKPPTITPTNIQAQPVQPVQPPQQTVHPIQQQVTQPTIQPVTSPTQEPITASQPNFGGAFETADTPQQQTQIQTPQSITQPTEQQTQRPVSRLNMPSEANEIEKANKIIRILDAYRQLTDEQKSVAIQFITQEEFDINDEGKLAVKVINVDPQLPIIMKSLKEAKELDPVERAFHIMSLDINILYSLGNLVNALSSENLPDEKDKIKYSRLLVNAIDELNNRAIEFVQATESILSAATEGQ